MMKYSSVRQMPAGYFGALLLGSVAAIMAVSTFRPNSKNEMTSEWTRQVTCGGYTRAYSADERLDIVRRNIEYGIGTDWWLKERVAGINVHDATGRYPIKYRIAFSKPIPRKDAATHMVYVDMRVCEEQR